MIEVRRADYSDTHDAATIIALLDAYAQDPMGGSQPISDYAKRNLVTKLTEHRGLTLLAFWEKKPAGILNAFWGFSTFACKPLLNIHDLAVLSEHRGKGLSRQLMSALESIARQHDCCKLTLEVLSGNEVAKAAYLAYGFAGYELAPAKGQALFWEKKL